MKFKTISRSERHHTKDRVEDVAKMHRNPDPSLHPFEKGREYVRALNAAKLDKLFAKPFIAAMDGHSDGVFSVATNPKSLVSFASGACDGEVKVWDLTTHKEVWSSFAHSGFVRGLSASQDGQTFLSCGDDKTIRRWKFFVDEQDLQETIESDSEDDDNSEEEIKGGGKGTKGKSRKKTTKSIGGVSRYTEEQKVTVSPLSSVTCSYPVEGVDCHWTERKFVSCGASVEIWDDERLEPIHTFRWGADSVKSVKFNPAQHELIASCGSDRSVALYDLRASTPLRRVVLKMRSNAVAWNPMEPFNFAVANEDHNCYSFDVRNFSKALYVHKDHVSAVMDISFSPTGREFVTGSYDRTIRLFKSNSGKSHQIYHTTRMQRVFCARYTADAKFVLSGSDDTNIRIWKANASKSLGVLLPRQQRQQNYSDRLVLRYKHLKDIKRVTRDVYVPKAIYKARDKKRVMQEAEQTRMERRIQHSKRNGETRKAEREKPILKEIE